MTAVCGAINFSLKHLRGVGVRRVMESSFMYGAPAEPAPPENATEKKEW